MSILRICLLLILNFFTQALPLLSANAYEQSQWQEVNIKDTDLTDKNIFLQTVGGRLTARCNPKGQDLIPNFSNNNYSDLCSMRSTITPGSYGKILKVYKLKGSKDKYAIQWKITDVPNDNIKTRGRAKESDVQWVYFDPKKTPFLQLYIDNKGFVDTRIDDYLKKVAKNESISISGLNDEKNTVGITNKISILLNPNGTGDEEERANQKRQGLKTVVTELEVVSTSNSESASYKPGQVIEELPELVDESPAEAKTNGNFCSVPQLAGGNKSYPKFCSEKAPTQRVGKRWRTCPERKLGNISRHAQGAKTNYSEWLKELAKTAANETTQSTAKRSKRDFSNNCVNPALMMSIMDQESSFHPMSSNNSGDYGIAQFQKGTAQATQKYLEIIAESGSPMKHVIKKGINWRPPNCSVATSPWAKKLSKECFDSIQKNCVQDGKLVASLFCPQYAVRLQAFHFKQICEESIKDSSGTDMSAALMGNGDPVAQIRFLVSRYNRGNRIYNSASYYKADHGKYPSAREYGVLWEARRSASFRRGKNKSSTKFRGDGLAGQTINRCYNWRLAGLCGGLKDSLFSLYTKEMCNPAENISRPVLASDGSENQR